MLQKANLASEMQDSVKEADAQNEVSEEEFEYYDEEDYQQEDINIQDDSNLPKNGDSAECLDLQIETKKTMPTKCYDETVRETVEEQDDGFIDHKETGVTDGAKPTDHHFELTSKPLEINLYDD